MLFRLKQILKLGIKSLWMHRLRSTLTMLGIVFGVCSVIAMLAIGEGASREAQETIRQLGSTNLIIETVTPPEQQADTSKQQEVRSYGLTYADAESIYNTVPNVRVVVPIREVDNEALYFDRKVAVKVIGTIPWYTEIAPVNLIRGRFLTGTDMTYQQRVCVIDEGVANALFALEDPIGQHIKMRGAYFSVIGITETSPLSVKREDDAGTRTAAATNPRGSASGNVYIPLTTSKVRFSELSASWSSGSQKIARVELQKITIKVNSIDEVLSTRDIIDTALARLHKQQDYRIVVPLELLRQAARTRQIFSIVLGSIAAISLLVGGIGIMNIMLATVSERTREIGIRRALGARKRDIIIQFLSETLMLTLVGGVIGIVLGAVIPFFVTRFANMPTIITAVSLMLAFGISAAIGIIFGLYPAYRAANMDPIESLRHE